MGRLPNDAKTRAGALSSFIVLKNTTNEPVAVNGDIYFETQNGVVSKKLPITELAPHALASINFKDSSMPGNAMGSVYIAYRSRPGAIVDPVYTLSADGDYTMYSMLDSSV